jgi:hypothetical protein
MHFPVARGDVRDTHRLSDEMSVTFHEEVVLEESVFGEILF